MTDEMNIEEGATMESANTEVGLGKGIDLGTANIAAAVQNEEGGVTVNVERNAFLEIGGDGYSKSMLTKLNVPYVVHNGRMIVLGESAFELANVFGKETRRPMSDGTHQSRRSRRAADHEDDHQQGSRRADPAR